LWLFQLFYNTNKLIKNIENYFESAIEKFRTNFPDEDNIELNFKKLKSDLGGHVFNGIAESIIGSDITVFEVSDSNPNVMIELGTALTWNRRIIPLKKFNSPEIPSDISGQHWIKYEDSGAKIHDIDLQEKLDIMVERSIKKKRKNAT
jgi:hypothetical protein